MTFFNTSQLEFQGRVLGVGTQISKEKGTLAEGWSCDVAGSVSTAAMCCPTTLHGCDRQNIKYASYCLATRFNR